jgi:predicted permease
MTRPPRIALWLMARSLAADERAPVIGDLLEEFEARAGGDAAGARRWLRSQVLRSFGPNLSRRLRNEPVIVPEQRGAPPMNGFVTDLRFALRLARRSPLAYLAGFLSLAISLGLNLLLITIANAVLVRPLPVRAPSELRVMTLKRPNNLAHNFSYPDYEAVRDGVKLASAVVAYRGVQSSTREGEMTARIDGEMVSGNFFASLGVRIREGRGLGPADDRAGSAPAVVVSDRLWRTRFGPADLSGHVIALNGAAFTIVGIASAEFTGMNLGEYADFWVPLAQGGTFGRAEAMTRANSSWLTLLARIPAGVGEEPARQEIDAIVRSAFEARGRQHEPIVLLPGARGDSMLPTRLEARLLVLLAAGGFVLLVGCLNVANLQIARVEARRLELAVRAALGARRGQLLRLVLVDALLLAAAAGVAAVGLAWVAKDRVTSLMMHFGEPVSLELPIDTRVALAAVALSVFAAALIAIASGWHVLRPNPGDGLQESRSVVGTRRRTQQALVVAQFALSMALLTGAGLLVRTLHNLRTTDLGFNTADMVLAEVSPQMARMPPAATVRYLDEVVRSVRAVPGVQNAAVAHVMPLDFGGSRISLEVAGYVPKPDEEMELNWLRVSPGYFETLGLPLIAGRTFNEGDVDGQPRRIIVNETMARRYWPDGSAVGRFIRFDPSEPYTIEVVGVVADAHYRMVREEPQPSFYAPYAQWPFVMGVVHVRTAGDPTPRLEEIRRVVASVDRGVPVMRFGTLRQQIDRNLADERLAGVIGVTLAGATLLLAAVGLYSTMAFLVGRRTREMGVRLALGARQRDLSRLVVRDSLWLVVPGLALGLAVGYWGSSSLATILYRVGRLDPLTIAGAALILAAASLLASWIPARRAATVDPVVVLRE